MTRRSAGTARAYVTVFATCMVGLAPAAAVAETYEDVPIAPLAAPGQDAGARPAPEVAPPPPAEAADPDDGEADPAAAAQALADERYEELKEEVRQLRGVVAGRKPATTLTGYADVGFFVPQGDGSGFVQDYGSPETRVFPPIRGAGTAGCSSGDLLATPINSRGEPADLGNPAGARSRRT